MYIYMFLIKGPGWYNDLIQDLINKQYDYVLN